MARNSDRRTFLASASGIAATTLLPDVLAADDPQRGLIIGHPDAAAAGSAVLAAGGNAVDAVVAAALVAGVVAVPSAGIGGYGGHLILAGLPGNKVAAIDFNTAAPAALTPDHFAASETGEVKGKVNTYGWLAAGVPAVLAGLQLALDKHGTKRFPELVQPAIKRARDGFSVSKGFAGALSAARSRLAADPGSAKLFFANGKPLAEGGTFRNPDLATMLETLADRGCVASFYQGDIAEKIALAFRKNGGLLTAADLAAYKPAQVTPLSLDWNGYRIRTPPPASGGLTVLQTLAALQALGWNGHDDSSDQALVECLRVAWTDRLALLGDPKHTDVPVMKLLSQEYARESADRVRAAVRDKKPLQGNSDGRSASGTIHLNAVDASGLAASLTFTHGESLGAQVTVDGLGLVLGHGVSRFDPRAGRPNSPGPGKRPLHNMCPTVVTKDEVAVLALGATGGRRIVSAVACVLARRFGECKSLAEAVQAPRYHAEGNLALTTDEGSSLKAFTSLGYSATTGKVATLFAIQREQMSGELTSAAR